MHVSSKNEYVSKTQNTRTNICRKCVAWLYSTIVTVNRLRLVLLIVAYIYATAAKKNEAAEICMLL